ncbi:hypothetical protein LXL04_033903 [Taraxacum kok-saghyz]
MIFLRSRVSEGSSSDSCLLQTVPTDILKKRKAIADAYNSPDEDFALQNLDPNLKQLESIHNYQHSSIPPTGPTPPYLFTQKPKPKPLHEIHMGIPRFLLCMLARLLGFRCQFHNTPARPSPIMARSSTFPLYIYPPIFP